MKNNTRIHVASYNAERFWKNKSDSTLPFFLNQHSTQITLLMDELSAIFSQNMDDIVITYMPFNETLHQYLYSIGLEFSCNKISLRHDVHQDLDICTLLLNQKISFNNQLLQLCTFAVTPGTSNLCNQLRTINTFPDFEVIRRVNSKIYSTNFSNLLQVGASGCIVSSAEELKQVGMDLLSAGSILIKEPFGVSGNGNLHIRNQQSLLSIFHHLQRQEHQGMITSLIIEPYLNKKIDFSCQCCIDSQGGFSIVSIQQMLNSGFRFAGIQPADRALISQLGYSKYFDTIELTMKALYSEGYYGNVCIDSMILMNDIIVDIVEINARKSMGLLSHHLSLLVKKNNPNANTGFNSLPLTKIRDVYFEELLDAIIEADLLFTKSHPIGILPLSANTFNIYPVCRLFYGIISNNMHQKMLIINKLDKICYKLGLKAI